MWLFLTLRAPTLLEVALSLSVPTVAAPLTAAWCVVGPGPWYKRAGTLLLAWLFVLSLAATIPAPSWRLPALAGLQFVVAIAVLGVPRSLGHRLDWPTAESHALASPLPAQFTLRHLLGWMVAAAIVCAGGLALQRRIGGYEFFMLLCMTALCSVAPLALLVPGFSSQPSARRWAIAALLILVVAFGSSFILIGRPGWDVLEPVTLVLGQCAVLAGIYLAGRRWGLRWVR